MNKNNDNSIIVKNYMYIKANYVSKRYYAFFALRPNSKFIFLPFPLQLKTNCINFRDRTLSCTDSVRNVTPAVPEPPPESSFNRARRLTKEHVQAMQDNPITFHCCPPEGDLARLLTFAFTTFLVY